MAKITPLALHRKYERIGDAIIKRAEPLPTFTKEVGTCSICKLPIFAAPGQAMRTGVHKKCARDKGLWKK